MDAAQKLLKEVQPVAQSFEDTIEQLERRAKQKADTISSIQQDISEKEQRISELNVEAKEAVSQGEDPRPLLQEASRLRSETGDLQEFVTDTGQADSEEQQQIAQLKDDLRAAVGDAIEESKAKTAQAKAFLEALRSAVKAYDDWQAALQRVYGELGLGKPKASKLSELRDSSEEVQLARRISFMVSKHQNLFL